MVPVLASTSLLWLLLCHHGWNIFGLCALHCCAGASMDSMPWFSVMMIQIDALCLSIECWVFQLARHKRFATYVAGLPLPLARHLPPSAQIVKNIERAAAAFILWLELKTIKKALTGWFAELGIGAAAVVWSFHFHLTPKALIGSSPMSTCPDSARA